MQRDQRRLRVLYLTNVPAPYRVAFFNELAKACDLTVLYERRRARDRNAAWISRESTAFRAVHLRGPAFQDDAAFCPGVLRWVVGSSFDVVVVGVYSTPTAMLSISAMRACRIPFIISSDGGRVRQEGTLRRTLKRTLISSATAWLSSGEVTTEYLTHYGAARERTYTYPFSSVRSADVLEVPVDAAGKQALRDRLAMPEPHCVLTVGQFIHRKGIDILIRAAAQLPSRIGVYVVGGLPTAEYLRLRDELGAHNVHFVGFLGDSELTDYYNAADVFAFPTRMDVWGLVVTEAMAHGLPVVTTDKCGAGLETVEDGINGFLVPAEDVEALAETLRRVLADDRHRTELARASLARARDFTIESMAAAHVDAFEKARELRHG